MELLITLFVLCIVHIINVKGLENCKPPLPVPEGALNGTWYVQLSTVMKLKEKCSILNTMDCKCLRSELESIDSKHAYLIKDYGTHLLTNREDVGFMNASIPSYRGNLADFEIHPYEKSADPVLIRGSETASDNFKSWAIFEICTNEVDQLGRRQHTLWVFTRNKVMTTDQWVAILNVLRDPLYTYLPIVKIDQSC